MEWYGAGMKVRYGMARSGWGRIVLPTQKEYWKEMSRVYGSCSSYIAVAPCVFTVTCGWGVICV